jgi:hypothetical protein
MIIPCTVQEYNHDGLVYEKAGYRVCLRVLVNNHDSQKVLIELERLSVIDCPL